MTAPEADFPWCQGTWSDRESALTALSRTASQPELARLILRRRAAKGRMDLFGIDRMRFRQIEALARLLGASDTDELATAEAARGSKPHRRWGALADASRATFFALQDPLLARRTFATVPPQAYVPSLSRTSSRSSTTSNWAVLHRRSQLPCWDLQLFTTASTTFGSACG